MGKILFRLDARLEQEYEYGLGSNVQFSREVRRMNEYLKYMLYCTAHTI